MATNAVDAGDPAVLDEFSDPCLCVDWHPFDRRFFEPVLVVDWGDIGTAHDPEYQHSGLYWDRLHLSAVHDPADLRDTGEDGRVASRGGGRPWLHTDAGVLAGDVPTCAAGRDCRVFSRIYSDAWRVRDPVVAGWFGHADDRQSALGRVL